MADSSFFTDGGSDSGTFDTIEGKIAEAEAAKVAAQAAQAAAEQAEADAQTAESQAEAAKDAAELAQAGATGSETNSASSATSAGNHAADAQKLAVNPEDSQYTLSDGSTTGYSALHYNEKANDSAVAAAADASTATTKAGEAAASAGTASTDAATATTKAGEASVSAAAALQSEQNASQSETNAGQSETNAGQSETNAAASASTATTQAGIATTQAGIATTQAGTATTQAGTATTKAGEASNSASSALSAQTAAEAARDSALSALDSFDDRFLGVKSQAPTVDNDGDALVAGALYFDSSTTSMKVYSGSQWLNAYASLSGALLATNNLSDLNNAGTARTNLGLAAVASSGDLLDLGITDGTNGQALKTDGAGNFAFGDVATSTAWTDITGKPTTISGFGITDAFDGAYSSLTGTPDLTNYITNNVGGDFTVDSGTLFVDSSTNRVGINLGSGVSPTVPLNVAGTVRFQSTSSSGQMLEFTNYSSYSKLYRSNGHLQFQGGNTGNGILELSNSGGFTFDGNTIYHSGNLPTIPTNNNQLTNGAGYITSADGGNADTVDGLHASSMMQNFSQTTNDLNTLTTSGAYRLTSSNSNRPADWGQMLTVYGGADTIGQLYFDYTDGNIFSRAGNPSDVGGSGSWSAWRTIWSDENDGSGSGLDADLLDGYDSAENGSSKILRTASNGYINLQNWVNVGSAGIYSSTTNGAHFHPNTATSYATWRTQGSKGGYDGIVFTNGGSVAIMYDSSGNGGLYREANSRWHLYHHVANNCLAVGNSTTSSAYELYVHGDIYATGNIVAYSDARVKENVETIDGALGIVEQLRGVYYNKIDNPDKTREMGFIAQEVSAVEGASELVTYAEDVDQYAVSYGNTAALLVEAVKELSAEVKTLKAEIEELKKG